MRNLFISIFILICPQVFSQDITGNWQGNIEVSGQKIPIVFHFYKDSTGNIDGKWDSPKQNAVGLPFSEIILANDSVKLAIKMIGGSYKGKFIGNDSLTGMWLQAAGAVGLNFSRSTESISTDAATLLLPNEKEIAITSAAGSKIYGTLLSKNNNQKLAIIIAGSGPTDRDGNNLLGLKTNSYKMIAQALDSQNIASFRYDKRGVAKSISANMNEENFRFEDYINDAKRIFYYLHDSLGFKEIYILGHSEGSLVGMVAAEALNVKGFVSIAGAGRPIDEIIEEQLNNQSLPDSLKTKAVQIFYQLKQGERVENTPVLLKSIFRKSVQPYMISWLKYSPAVEIKKLKCPVLIVQGECDVQVKITDAENLQNANKKSVLDLIPLMTHTLKNAGKECEDKDGGSYADPSLPLNKRLIDDITGFIKK